MNSTNPKRQLIIAVDFDGTIVKHAFPAIGEPVPLAIYSLKVLQNKGHRIVLWTMRSGKELNEAIAYLEQNGVYCYAANDNPTQKYWAPDSRKVFAHIYIDDAALGCPLIWDRPGERPYADWQEIGHLLSQLIGD